MRYRQPAVITVTRDRTISCTSARLTHVLLNSLHRIHRVIIIARTVIGHRLKDPDRRPVSDSPTHTITLHNASLFDLYFATHILLFKLTMPFNSGGGAWWVAVTQCHSHTHFSFLSRQQRCVDCESLIRVSPQSLTKDLHPQTIAIRNLESAVRPHLNALLIVQTWMIQVARLSQRDRAAGWVQVIEVGTNRKPVCDFLLVINSNYHPISYCFGDIAAYCSNFRHFAFLSHPLGA